MLPLGLGRNSAGLLRALRTPIPRSPGLPDAAGSGVLSGWRNLRRKPCRIRLCRRFSRRASGMPSCAFLRRSARAKPEPFVARQSRRVAALASAADAGRAHGGGLACAAFAFGALPGAGAARPSCRARIPAHRRAFACELREAAFPAMFRRRHERRRSAAESSPDFPAFPAGWRKVMRRGKRCLLPGRENGRSAEDQVSRTPDNQAEASAFVRISPCAWRRAPVPWWR